MPESVNDAELEGRLFPPQRPTNAHRPLPNWPYVHAELRRKGVTLSLLWREYKADNPEGLQYSLFCPRYQGWAGKFDVVMRQTHRAGEKQFVD